MVPVTCQNCKGKPTEKLSGQAEKELIEKIITAMKEYPISYNESYNILSCVKQELEIRSSYLHL